ncbi:MAG TPA: hypothetical protein VMW38_12060 [Terriglobia bacterium]|nr:hypothetical protein [Terriglobia bacterium]
MCKEIIRIFLRPQDRRTGYGDSLKILKPAARRLTSAYQVYATLVDKYPRPIPKPIENLRPARETCEQCHWPRKFFGEVERDYHHFLPDEENSPWTIRMLVKIGGGDPSFGPVGGIHWPTDTDHTPIDSIDVALAIPWLKEAIRKSASWVPGCSSQLTL